MASSEDEIQINSPETMSLLVERGDLETAKSTFKLSAWIDWVRNNPKNHSLITSFLLVLLETLLLVENLSIDNKLQNHYKNINGYKTLLKEIQDTEKDLENLKTNNLNKNDLTKELKSYKKEIPDKKAKSENSEKEITKMPKIGELNSKIKEINKILPADIEFCYFGFLEKDFEKNIKNSDFINLGISFQIRILLKELSKNLGNSSSSNGSQSNESVDNLLTENRDNPEVEHVTKPKQLKLPDPIRNIISKLHSIYNFHDRNDVKKRINRNEEYIQNIKNAINLIRIQGKFKSYVKSEEYAEYKKNPPPNNGGKGQRRRRGTKKTSHSNRRKSSRRNRRRTRRSRKVSRR